MKLPQLAKKPELKSCHDVTWEDNYSWIHQKDILEVLKDKEKLNPEVRKYLEEENSYTELQLKDTEDIQKKLFDEIKGRIKLEGLIINLKWVVLNFLKKSLKKPETKESISDWNSSP